MIKKIMNNDYIFSVVAKIITVITGIIYSILYSRYLGAELRGTASVITNYAEMASLIMCLGVYQAYPFFKKKNKKDIYLEYINYIFGMLCIYILVASIIAIYMSHISNIYVFASLLAPVLMAIKQLNYVVMIENPKLRNTASIKLELFDILFLIILMLCTKVNYIYCIIFLITKNIVYLIIAISNLKINITKIRPTLRGIMPYIKYGFIPMLTVILMEINYKIDVLMLEKMNVSMVDIGIYSLGVMLAQKIWLIPDALKDVLLSKLAKGREANEVARISRFSFTITIALIIIMIIIGKPLITVMYGSEYSSAYLVTLIILSGVLGMTFYKLIYSYNVVNGHKNINFIILSFTALINIIINYLLIPKNGMIGAAIASLVSYCFCGIVFLMYFCYKTKINIFNMICIKKDDIKSISKIIRRNNNVSKI